MKQNQQTYIIQGAPIPLARPRFYQGKVYDSQRPQKIRYKSNLKVLAKLQKITEMLDGPLWIQVGYHMPIPASWSAKKKLMMNGQPHISKPDLSNLLKWTEDCLTEMVFKDDALICRISCYKVYSTQPRTELMIQEISDGKND